MTNPDPEWTRWLLEPEPTRSYIFDACVWVACLSGAVTVVLALGRLAHG